MLSGTVPDVPGQLNTYPTRIPVLLELVSVDEARLGTIGKGLVQELQELRRK